MSLTASGIGSGLDISGMVSQLMGVERQPLLKLQARQADYQTQLSSYGQYRSALVRLQDAVKALRDTSTFSAVRAQVGPGAGFSATANASAKPGSYDIRVDQLATPQLVKFVPTQDSEGEYNVVLSAKNNAGERVTLEFLDQATVSDLADAINDSGLMINATVINDGSKEWLVLRGEAEGETFDVVDRQVQTTYNPPGPKAIDLSDGGASVAQVTQFTPTPNSNGEYSIGLTLWKPDGTGAYKITSYLTKDTLHPVNFSSLSDLRDAIANDPYLSTQIQAEVVGSDLKLTALETGWEGFFAVTDVYGANPYLSLAPTIAAQDPTKTATFTPGTDVSGQYSITITTMQPVVVTDTRRKTSTLTPTPTTATFTAGSLAELAQNINTSLNDPIRGLGLTASVTEQGQLQVVSPIEFAGETFSVTDNNAPNVTTTVTDKAITPDPEDMAQGAVLYVDGIRVERDSNTISDLIDGVTLTLTETMEDESELKILSNHAVATTAITNFVNAYNSVWQTYKNLTAYNPETKQASSLTTDGALRNIQMQVRDLMGTRISGIGWEWEAGVRAQDQSPGLLHLGIRFQKDGTLKLDGDQLATALKRPGMDVAGFFIGKPAEGTTPKITGFAERVSKQLDSYLRAGGVLDARQQGIQSSIDAIEKRSESLNLRMDLIEARYQQQFTDLDILISNMTTTSNALTQQLKNLPGAYSGQES